MTTHRHPTLPRPPGWRALLWAALSALALLAPATAQAAAPCQPGLTALELPDGGRYCGQMQGGKLHGQGRIDWGEGRYYVGHFAGGFMDGAGRMVGDDHDYTGQFRRGAMSGRGKLARSDGVVYEGDFARNQMHGQGTLSIPEQFTYEGRFDKDRPHGHGRMTYPGGASVEGQFDNYQVQGPATLIWPTGERFEGPLLGGRPHGEGAWTRADKAVVRGTFEFGGQDGQGRVQYPDGATYTGQMKDRHAQGPGELRRADGAVYRGQFADDKFDGEGRLTLPDGTVQLGHWRAGAYLGLQGDGTLPDTPELMRRNAEAVLYNQQALLQRQWDQLQPSGLGAPRLYALYLAGDGRQEVFRREVAYVDQLFARRFGTRGRSVSLVNSRSSTAQLPLATAHSVGLALGALAAKMDRQRDLLFVFLTSHGSNTHELSLGLKGLALPDLSAQRLAELLKASGIRNQVVVVSACYSGGFVPLLQGERTWVITSASADRTSFGCADDNEFTYFGRALFKDTLPAAATLGDAFAQANRLVTEWEQRDAADRREAERKAAALMPRGGDRRATAARAAEEKKDERSLPQSVVSPAFQAEVDAWFRAHPPVSTH